ncbi:MAG: hypothetical protein HY053_05485 [Proteobacteria bacterium]|nr:hypothetical protein [Pseudomonadota bacterium]
MKISDMKWAFIKNALLVLLLLILYPVIQREFSSVTNLQTLNTLLLFVGLIIVAPLFANFQFSYQFSIRKNPVNLIISHVATFLAMLVCGLLIAMVDVIFVRLVGNILVFRMTLFLFLVSLILWDFWDFWRLGKSD